MARERRIAFRIGINFGEVIVDQDEISGHGVVIAVRLESLADPDGIFIAQGVYEQIRADPRFRTAYLGERLIKNVDEPIPVYRVVFEALSEGAARAETAHAAEALPAVAAIPPCPYRGLFAFREEDAPFFFGRDQATAELEQAVQRRALVTLLGASGSGKSSLVFAGLVPRLRAQGGWLITSFRPDDDPFRGLLRALAATLDRSDGGPHRIEDDRASLERSRARLAELVAVCLDRAPGQRLLIIGDQFEQIYTLCQDDERRDGFIEALLALGRDGALRHDPPPVVVLLTLRADFLSQALGSHAFAEALRGGDVKLGPMTTAELRAAIENPARKLGVRFEMGLVDRILTDVQSQPGGLPLLEFALTELWSQQRNGRLSHLGYQDIGGVAEAIAAYAERVYVGLDERSQQLARQVFLQLVRPGQGTEDTRRIASRAEIDDQRWQTVTRLADARLVVTQRDEGSGEDIAEVVHEALIHEWRRLRQWVDDDREYLVWRQRLSDSRREWERWQRAEGFLLRETPLAVALDWLEKRGDELKGTEDLSYIEASRARQEREQQERERARREREAERHRAEIERQRLKAEAARRLAQRTRIAAVALTIVALIAAGFGWWGYDHSVEAGKQKAIAEDQARIATEQREVALALQRQAEANEDKARAAEQNAVIEKQRAEAEARRAQVKESQLLALLSRQETRRGDAVTGMLLALKGLPEGFEPLDRPIEGEATRALIAAMHEQQELAVRHGHDGPVRSAAFSADGTRIVTASEDATARVWNVAGGGAPIVLRGHEGRVWAAAFSPDGARVVTASEDATVRLWDAARGVELAVLRGHEGGVRDAAFSPDGTRIASVSEDATARLWDAARGSEVAVLRGHEREVWSVGFGPDGLRVVTGSRDATARVWDAKSGAEIVALRGHEGEVWSASFSPDGRRVVTASRDFTVRLWDASNGAEIAVLRGHEGEVWDAAFSPDGARIVTASTDFTARLWGSSGAAIVTLRGHQGEVWGAAFSPDGGQVVTASGDHTIRLWAVSSGAELAALRGHEHWVLSAAFSPTGERLVTASMDRTARVWDVASRAQLAVLRGHDNGVWAAAFSPDGERIVTGSMDGTARLWDLATGAVLAVMRGHDGEARSPAFSPDGSRIVTASGDRTARIWDAASGKELTVLEGHGGEVWSAVFSPDGTRILTASMDHTGRIWDVGSGAVLAVLQGHEGVVRSAAYSPDGARIATASRDGTARVWDVASSTELAVMRGHQGEVRSVAFSPDGRYLVTTSSDHTARVWDVASGAELAVLRGHEDWLSAAAFSPDGALIVTASDDGTARLWDAASMTSLAALPVEQLIAEAKRRLPRDLTSEQQARFFLATD